MKAFKSTETTPETKTPQPQPPLPPSWDRCHAYNHRKRRYCRQIPVPLFLHDDTPNPPRYCGNHAHMMANCVSIHASKRHRTEVERDEKQSNRKERGKRVPCPVDPSHLIFESAVARHVLVCPAARLEKDVAKREYYVKDINRGGFGGLYIGSENKGTGDGLLKKRHNDLAIAVLRVFSHLFLDDDRLSDTPKNLSIEQLKSLTEQEMYKCIPEVDLSYAEEHPMEPDSVTDETAIASRNQVIGGRLSEAIARHRIKAGGTRHIHQIASILGHLRKNCMLTNAGDASKQTADANKSIPSLNVIEMGAGRGMLGLVVAGAASASPNSRVQLFLVDRSGSRAKAETKIRTAAKDGAKEGSTTNDSERDCLKLDTVKVTRIKCDLAHVDMPTALPFLSSKSTCRKQVAQSAKTIVIAKHLCGGGTDLALKSLCELAPGVIDGCVMATCCHGLCDWNDYTGRQWLLELFCNVGGLSTFGKEDFDVLKRWTSASVLEDRDATEEGERHHTQDIVVSEKDNDVNIFHVVQELALFCGGNGLGRACQRIIDYGRCEYMRNNLFCPLVTTFNVKLFHYVPRKVTPQNALLIAYPE